MSKSSGSFVVKKAQYYVWYLGWKECRGLGGREFTEPIVKELVHRRKDEELPKLTIEVSKKELKILQLVEKKKGKIEKVKYPPVLSKDVTYAVQALSPDEDVVACIYLGFNPHTKCAVHVHVYRCDSIETARLMVSHLNQISNLPEHVERARRIEEELANKGQVVPRPGILPIPDDTPNDAEGLTVDVRSNGSSPASKMPRSPRVKVSPRVSPRNSEIMTNPRSPRSPISPRSPQIPQSPRDYQQLPSPSYGHNGSNTLFVGHTRDEYSGMHGNSGVYRQKYSANDDDRLDEEAQAQCDSLADELRRKLGGKPLLLPAKDYDTINRIRGNAYDEQNRKCQNANIVGRVALKGSRLSKIDSTGTDDSARGESETGSQQNSQDGELDPMSPGMSDPSPRSLKSSGRFSAGFMGEDFDEADEELTALSSPGSSGFVDSQRPFSPGPNTQDLRKSYFPGDQTLPGYLPNGRSRLPQESYNRGYHTVDRDANRGNPKYSASTLGLAGPPTGAGRGPQGYGRQRSQDEGYTSLERRDYPPGYFDQDAYAQRNNRNSSGPYSPREADFSGSGPAFTQLNRKASKLRRQPDINEPPIDYTIAVRHNEREFTHPNSVFQ